MWVTKQLMGPIDIHGMGKRNTMEVNGADQLFAYPTSSSRSVQQKKEIHTGLEHFFTHSRLDVLGTKFCSTLLIHY